MSETELLTHFDQMRDEDQKRFIGSLIRRRRKSSIPHYQELQRRHQDRQPNHWVSSEKLKAMIDEGRTELPS